MIALAAVGAFINQQTDILTSILGENQAMLVAPVLGALLASVVRWLEGMRDSVRNKEGELVKADVGYNLLSSRVKRL